MATASEPPTTARTQAEARRDHLRIPSPSFLRRGPTDTTEIPGGLTFAEIATLGRRAAAPFATKDRGDVDTWAWDGWVEAALTEDVEVRVLPYFFTRDQFVRQSGISFG